MGNVTIDVIAQSKDGSFILYLVEEGPWEADQIDDNLSRVLTRVYDVVEVLLNGQLVGGYPGIKGKPVTIRVDFFDTPREESGGLVDAIAKHLASSRELADSLQTSGFATELRLEHSWKSLQDDDEGAGQ